MERDQAVNNMDQLHALFQMTYVQAKVLSATVIEFFMFLNVS